jgi:S1-C subfamily serine protease
MWFLCIISILLYSVPASAILGDLNNDGNVNLADFHILADNFGNVGEPEVVASVRDTVYLSGSPSRSPIAANWSEVVTDLRSSVYWIGYTAKPQGSTRFDVVFVGSGFSIDGSNIVTNYHVASYVDNQIKSMRSDLTPVMIAVRAGTRIFEDGTYYLGRVSDDRDLLGYWDVRYDFTVSSPDIAIFTAYDANDGSFISNLASVTLASTDVCMGLGAGEDIGILGFPGVLETNHSPNTLTPTPTFKSGTISALRSYNESTSLSTNWKIALVGKVIQHSLETAPGNSGSPIFNKRGEVVAIHNAGIPGGESFNFGIRSDEIRTFLKSLYVGLGAGTHFNAKYVVRGSGIGVREYKRPR